MDGASEPGADAALVDVVTAVWRDIIGTHVGPDDDFFAVDGDSMKATVITTRLRGRLGVSLSLRDFLTGVSTPRALAASLVDRGLIARAPEDGAGPVPS